MSTEWYKKHRPKAFDDMVGQTAAARQLSEFVRKKAVPHALCFTGPSGCGKTTAARILGNFLGCDSIGYREINASSDRGIDMVREIQGSMHLSPMKGKVKVYVLDECHALPKTSQEALLKTLEDTPKHVYFILCTSDPGKLIAAVKTRTSEVKFGRLTVQHLKGLVASVLKKQKTDLPEDIIDRLVEAADGSARKCLVLLEQIAQVEDEDDRLSILEATDKKSQGWELAKLLHNPYGKWPEAAALLQKLDEDAEGVRRVVLKWAESVLLKGGKLVPRAAKVLDKFQYPVHETGRPQLTLLVYEFYHSE